MNNKFASTIVAAIFAALTLINAASAAVTITRLEPKGGGDLVSNTMNAILPVATVSTDGEGVGQLINGLYIQYSGDFLEEEYKSLELCLLDGNKILWQAPARFVVNEWEDDEGNIHRSVYDEFDLSLYIAKGEQKQLTLGIIRRTYVDSARELQLNFYLYHSPERPGYTYGWSGRIWMEGNSDLSVWIQPADSLKDAAVKPGKHILGGFRFEAYSNNWWDNDEEFEITNPTFRMFTAGGKATDVLALELRDEIGTLLLKKAIVTNVGAYSLVQFQGRVFMPRGQVALFVHGRVGATFKAGASLTMAFVAADQGTIVSSIDGAFSVQDSRPYRSRELTFGVRPPPIKPPVVRPPDRG